MAAKTTILALIAWAALATPCMSETVYNEVRASVDAAYPGDFWKRAAVTRVAGAWHDKVIAGQPRDSRAEVTFYRQQMAEHGVDLCDIATPRLRVALQQAGYG